MDEIICKAPQRDLMGEEDVRMVLLADKGSEATLLSWEFDDFIKKGENFGSVVTGIKVKYCLKDELFQASYVAKLNYKKETEILDAMNKELFRREWKFYQITLPELNAVLQSAGQPALNFPRCVHWSLIDGKEQLYFEDLREGGFHHADRHKELDMNHVTVVLSELARLHAASLLLQEKYSEPMEVRYKYLKENVIESENYLEIVKIPLFLNDIAHMVEVLRTIGGYEKEIVWVKSLKSQLKDIFTAQMRNGKYDVLCHGDIWVNNILYRQKDDSSPLEVMFVDLAFCRKASPVTELTRFLHCNLNSILRRTHLRDLFHTYYSSFRRVFDGWGTPMPFSEREIAEEFHSKFKLGFLGCTNTFMCKLMEHDLGEVPCTEDLELNQEIKEKIYLLLKKKPLVKQRLLGIVKELKDLAFV